MSTPSFDAVMAAAAKRLALSGIDAARREARLLMALAADVSTAQLLARSNDSVPGCVAAKFEEMVHRREGREPFQHIAGYASFMGHEFISDARALVPRADSEVVVEAALKRLPRGRGVTVADLGAGSGCLLASILLARGGAGGIAVEADAAAASLARENLKRHDLTARAEVFAGSWGDWMGWNRVDLIISNPPYIASAVIETLDPEVRLHDPVAALDGGADGLDAYRDIIARAAGMKPGAWLVFEIGYDQETAVRALLETASFAEIDAARDLAGQPRVVWARR